MLLEGAHAGAGAGGADREGKGPLHRVGVGRDDSPADDVGPFHRRRQGDAHLVRPARPGARPVRSAPVPSAELKTSMAVGGAWTVSPKVSTTCAGGEATTTPLAGEVPSSWAWANAGAAKARTPATATTTPTPARARATPAGHPGGDNRADAGQASSPAIDSSGLIGLGRPSDSSPAGSIPTPRSRPRQRRQHRHHPPDRTALTGAGQGVDVGDRRRSGDEGDARGATPGRSLRPGTPVGWPALTRTPGGRRWPRSAHQKNRATTRKPRLIRFSSHT